MEANYLVAWVPPDFIQLASRGVRVNPEQCIRWLDAQDDEFVRSLRRLVFFLVRCRSRPFASVTPAA